LRSDVPIARKELVVTRLTISLFLLTLIATGCSKTPGAEPKVEDAKAREPKSQEKAPTPETLKADINGLKAAKVAWREIAWKSCLLEGLKEARAKNKPALLWVFIDRPIDDARC
jgi:hypothetical protein